MPQLSDASNQSNQPNQPTQPDQASQSQSEDQSATQHKFGQSEEYAQSGTLAEGYGQGQQMAEDQWSADRYQAQAAQVDQPTLDADEVHADQKASDIDQMTGGMIGSEDPELPPDQRQ